MNPLWIILGIVILTYIVYLILSYFLSTALISPTSIGPEQIDLSSVSQLASSEQLSKLWTQTDGATLSFFIYPVVNDRTSVSGNEYANVVQLGRSQTFKLLVVPDAGRGHGMAPAILEVYTKSTTSSSQNSDVACPPASSGSGNIPIGPDEIDIPGVPLQRWTSVVIVKQGRKFNIYINGKLSVSHMCTAMPDFDTSQPLRTGDKRLGGLLALMSLAPYPMQAAEVRSMVQRMADTTGKPYLSSGISLPTLKISDITEHIVCPGGNCSTPIQTGPMEEWSSPYA